jgi:integrase
VLATLKKTEARGALETASKSRVLASQVFRHAIVTGRLQIDPAAHLSGAMIARAPVNRATIPLTEMPALFAALAKVLAEANTRLALYWLVLTATRTSEMRFAAWAEIDAKAKLWRIPAARMKMREPHIVPLSKQSLRVLELAAPLRRSDEGDALIFPGFTRHGALSENALLALLARAGFYGRQTSHGFRAAFSTWAHETHEADPDVVEACLAHVKEGVRGIYNRASYLSRRLELLQAWADQCTAWGMSLW